MRVQTAPVIGWVQKRWAQACSDTIGTEQFWSIAVDHITIRRNPRAPDFAPHEEELSSMSERGASRGGRYYATKAAIYFASDTFFSHPELAFLM